MITDMPAAKQVAQVEGSVGTTLVCEVYDGTDKYCFDKLSTPCGGCRSGAKAGGAGGEQRQKHPDLRGWIVLTRL